LVNYRREWLTNALVLVCGKLTAARAALEDMTAKTLPPSDAESTDA
jgi:hypothetical protein